jgi:hypothetical protein
MQENLFEHGRFEVDPLDAVWGNILPLLQFEDVLLAIDDFEGQIGADFAHIPGLDPAIDLDGFLVGFVPLVVSLEDLRPSHPDLAPRSQSPLAVSIP